MSDDQQEQDGPDWKQIASARATRVRSEISFPYASLDAAMTVVQVMHKAGGIPLTRDQIIGQLAVGNSVFVDRTSAAAMFGLVRRSDKAYAMTPLADRILSEEADIAAQARAEAFLIPELYKKIIEHFRGRVLPGRDGLENVMENFGVSAKQKERARQVFERSAAFAGFFNAGKDRLIAPIISAQGASRTLEPAEQARPEPEKALVSSASDPLIKGLLDRLPALGKPWSLHDRAWWLRALSINFAMIYGEEGEGEIAISAPSKAETILKKIGEVSTANTFTLPQVPEAPKPTKTSFDKKPASSAGGWDTAGDLDDDIPF